KVFTVRAKVKRFQLAANRYDSAESRPDHWFSLNGGFVIPARWSTETGDTSRIERVDYPDPPPTLPEGLLAVARARSRRTWNADATARVTGRRLLEAFQT